MRRARQSTRPPGSCGSTSTALEGEKVTGEERLLQGLRERIRDVRVGPDGAIYLATDNNAGRILKVVPVK
jgi:glucose/arabinose dehydrogenase